jgi:hypothetical protein
MNRMIQRILLALLSLPEAQAANPPIHVPNSPLTVTDVSPDSGFQTTLEGGVDTGGRIRSLVIDPTNDQILYAGSEWAGVWKSVNGGAMWQQASTGLGSGMTFSNTSLAVDPVHPLRLLYATQDDDGTSTKAFRGLYVSIDGAGHWQHVGLACASGPPSIYSVVFASSRPPAGGPAIEVPYVTTACGIWSTLDPNLLTGWHLIVQQLPGLANGVLAAPRVGSTVFACSSGDGRVYRSSDPAGGQPWQAGPPLIGLCNRIAVAPLNQQLQPSVLVVLTVSPTDQSSSQTVQVVDFDHVLPFLNLGWPDPAHNDGSGVFGVFTVLRRSAGQFETTPGIKYDVYAGSGFNFYRFNPSSKLWDQLKDLHVDTWAMAFASTYDPPSGHCTAHASSDGGVYTTVEGSVAAITDCVGNSGVNSWGRASAGLHAMWAQYISGFSEPSGSCPLLTYPCPILYFPSADNDTWIFRPDGLFSSNWFVLGDNLGDSGEVFIDPALRDQALSARGGGGGGAQPCTVPFRFSVSNNGQPPTDANSTAECTGLPDPIGGTGLPDQQTVWQVAALPQEIPSTGTYMVVLNPSRDCQANQSAPCSSKPDIIARTIGSSAPLSAPQDISPNSHFGPAEVRFVATSGGITNTTVYVLTETDIHPCGGLASSGSGKLFRGFAGQPGGQVAAWLSANGGLGSPTSIFCAKDLFVNPYSPGEVYVTDSDGHIKTTFDGGITWQIESVLDETATNFNEFRFAENDGSDKSIFGHADALNHVAFSREDPNIRVAALYPGGLAFSRDSGQHWMPLNVTNHLPTIDLRELVQSVWWDHQPNPSTGQGSIYMGLRGRSIQRVDGPFSTLQSAGFMFCGTCSALAVPSQVEAFVPALNARVPLQRTSNGLFRGNFLFDYNQGRTLTYYFVVDGVQTQTFTKALSNDEIASGVATLTNVGTSTAVAPSLTPSAFGQAATFTADSHSRPAQ